MHVGDTEGAGDCGVGGADAVRDGDGEGGRDVTGTVGRDAVAVGEDADGDALADGVRECRGDADDDAGASADAEGDPDVSGSDAPAEGDDVPSGTSGADGVGADSPPDSAAMESIASAPARATAPTP